MRTEKDSLGEKSVPADAYFGIATQRAVENFPISGTRLPSEFIHALGTIKLAAARVNRHLGAFDNATAEAIIQACEEVIRGELDDEFPVDVFQTGSGTSTNMNANEVIANRAIEILGGEKGSKSPVHPNDDVNRGQSSNDVIPSALHVAARVSIDRELLPSLHRLKDALEQKAQEFGEVVKVGRTHLQDATPVTLGQEFAGYAAQIRAGIQRIELACSGIEELALGGTAVGTGLNAQPGFAERVIARISEDTGLDFTEAADHFEAQSARDAAVMLSGSLRTVAGSLAKIANDIRWLAAGPRGSLGEIEIPALQPGSSIMPGKINPVLCESVLQVAMQVVGNDTTIAVAGQSGSFELNVTIPLIAHNLLESIRLISNVSSQFVANCVEGIEPRRERCRDLAERSLSLATALVPHIGYDQATEIAKEAFRTDRSVFEVALEQGQMTESELRDVLDPMRMTRGGILGE